MAGVMPDACRQVALHRTFFRYLVHSLYLCFFLLQWVASIDMKEMEEADASIIVEPSESWTSQVN